MARSVAVELILDASKYLRGSRAATDSNKDLSGSLAEVARDGERTSRSMAGTADEMSDAARAANSLDRKVEELTRSLRSLAVQQALGGGDFTKQIREQERHLRRITKDRNIIGDPDEVATGFVARLQGRMGPLIAKMPLAGPMTAVLGGAAAVAAPTIGATVAAAVVGGARIGGVSCGVFVAARDPRVRSAGILLGEFVMGDLEQRAAGFVEPALAGIADIRSAWTAMGGDLDRIFASSRFIDPLVEGITTGTRKMIAGIADAVEEADPVIEQVGFTVSRIGAAVGNTFSLLSEDAEEGATALDDLTIAAENALAAITMMTHQLAVTKGALDNVDFTIDSARYKLENLIGPLDITADGFAKGSKEAEAYRQHTLGTATAADYAVLKQAGLAAGLGGTELAMYETALATEATRKETEELTASQKRLEAVQQGLEDTFRAIAPSAAHLTSQVDALRRASDLLYGSAIRGVEANEAFEESWDSLTASIKANGRSLSIHTAAGRANRDALQALLTKNNELFLANVEAGESVEGATKKHLARTEQVRKEARQLGLNKAETQKLIATYGRIPPRKATDLVLSHVANVADALLDLAAIQMHLARGTPISASLRQRLSRAQYGIPDTKRAAGGVLPGTAPHDRADNMIYAGTPGEWVIQRPTVRKVQRQHGPAAMDYFNRYGELPARADGGLLRASRAHWPAYMRFAVNAGRTDVPSLAEAMSKVTPQFGHWPSSPSAQRGDSGVWKSILALVRGSGIPYQFGNAYRHNDPLWHGSGRAVDFTGYNQDRLAQFFLARQSRVLELIHRTNSRDYGVSRGRTSPMGRQWPLHRDHLHVAMGRGGALPGYSSAPQRVKVQVELVPGPGMNNSVMGRMITGMVGAQVRGNGGRVPGLT